MSEKFTIDITIDNQNKESINKTIKAVANLISTMYTDNDTIITKELIDIIKYEFLKPKFTSFKIEISPR